MDANLINEVRRRAGETCEDDQMPRADRRPFTIAVRTLTAVPLAPLLLFLLLAPQQSGACAELLVLRHSGSQLPPWLIVLAIVGHLSLLWWPVVFFGFPWVVGGAAGRFADHISPPERPRDLVARANGLYGPALALLILLAVAFAVLFASLYALPMWLVTRNDGRFMPPEDIKLMLAAAAHPTLLACSVTWWLAASAAVTAGALVLAAVAIEDIGLPRAARRCLAFARAHRADAIRLWLLVTLIGLPDVLLQQTFVLVPIPAIPLLATGLAVAAYNAYAILLTVAVAEATYRARASAS